MRSENEREVFERASSAKAHANSLKEKGELNGLQLMHLREIKEALEIIERRADPAAGYAALGPD